MWIFDNRGFTDRFCLYKGIKISDIKWEIETDVETGGSVGRIMLKKTFILR